LIAVLAMSLSACDTPTAPKQNPSEKDSLTIKHTTKSNEEENAPAKEPENIDIDDALIASLAWTDSLVKIYVNNSTNPLIQAAVKDSSIAWMPDNLVLTDTAKYLVYHLGHNLEDENHANPRFATDGWLYIDTLTRKLYEYDVANETLTLWINPNRN
jgi:hypothetical protein